MTQKQKTPSARRPRLFPERAGAPKARPGEPVGLSWRAERLPFGRGERQPLPFELGETLKPLRRGQEGRVFFVLRPRIPGAQVKKVFEAPPAKLFLVQETEATYFKRLFYAHRLANLAFPEHTLNVVGLRLPHKQGGPEQPELYSELAATDPWHNAYVTHGLQPTGQFIEHDCEECQTHRQNANREDVKQLLKDVRSAGFEPNNHAANIAFVGGKPFLVEFGPDINTQPLRAWVDKNPRALSAQTREKMRALLDRYDALSTQSESGKQDRRQATRA